MNGRRLFREYAQYKGKEAKEFVEIKLDYYKDILITKNSNGSLKETRLGYDDMIHWIIKTKNLE